jgi:hypothetical protein
MQSAVTGCQHFPTRILNHFISSLSRDATNRPSVVRLTQESSAFSESLRNSISLPVTKIYISFYISGHIVQNSIILQVCFLRILVRLRSTPVFRGTLFGHSTPTVKKTHLIIRLDIEPDSFPWAVIVTASTCAR